MSFGQGEAAQCCAPEGAAALPFPAANAAPSPICGLAAALIPISFPHRHSFPSGNGFPPTIVCVCVRARILLPSSLLSRRLCILYSCFRQAHIFMTRHPTIGCAPPPRAQPSVPPLPTLCAFSFIKDQSPNPQCKAEHIPSPFLPPFGVIYIGAILNGRQVGPWIYRKVGGRAHAAQRKAQVQPPAAIAAAFLNRRALKNGNGRAAAGGGGVETRSACVRAARL